MEVIIKAYCVFLVLVTVLAGVWAEERSIDYSDLSVPELETLANKGDAEAQAQLGWTYLFGSGIDQDSTEAVKWFRLAADQGDADEQFRLGSMYYQGQGVIQDYKEAVKWWRLAVDQGDAKAQANIRVLYYNEDGVERSYEQAYFWFLIATANAAAEDYDKFSEYREDTAAKLTTTQKNKIQQEAKAWMKEKGFE